MADLKRHDNLWFEQLRQLSSRMAAESDVTTLLPTILDAALQVTAAERGYLVRVLGRKPEGGYRFEIAVARGFDSQSLGAATVSRTVIRRVLGDEPRGLVTSSDADRDILDVPSVHGYVASILCVPLHLRGQVLGVLYLDHRSDRNVFSADDLPVLRSFGHKAALAMETADLLIERETSVKQLGDALAELKALKAAAVSLTKVSPDHRPSLKRFGRLVGGSPDAVDLYEEIAEAGRSWAPALIYGESGAGKALVAREIHARGSHPEEAFTVVRCVQPEEHLERTLFGYRKGAFPGATEDFPGALVSAGRGTVLLHEVSALKPNMQLALLSVLHEERVLPVGGGLPQRTACRLLSTSSQDLRARAASGEFRPDLLYRLGVLELHVSPLRERPEDVLPVLAHFLQEANVEATLSAEAAELCRGYSWPGNIRELENEALRLQGKQVVTILPRHLSRAIRTHEAGDLACGVATGTLAAIERERVKVALQQSDGNKSRAARRLGIARTTLYSLIKRHEL